MFRAGVLAVVAALAAAGTAAEPEGERLALARPSSAAALAEYLEGIPSPTSPDESAPPPESDPTSVRQAIEEANAQWLSAFRSGDADELALRYTSDASIDPPGNASIAGRERIAAWFGQMREAGYGGIRLRTVDVVRVGDLAYETGTWALAAEGTAGLTDSGRYYAIWKSQPDGSWACQVGTWTSSRELSLRR